MREVRQRAGDDMSQSSSRSRLDLVADFVSDTDSLSSIYSASRNIEIYKKSKKFNVSKINNGEPKPPGVLLC